MGLFSKSLVILLIGIIFTIIVSGNQVSGQCCRSRGANILNPGSCRDGTRGTPCCGYSRCNFFCCDCGEGGCRGKRWARDAADTHKHDKNKDGFYDKIEIYNLIRSGTCGNYTEKVGTWEAEFRRMDKDKDGKLSYEEING
ncbi:unnamed protein product [Orchesella dallaii]|uniref:EF-hand domain-containing protein n=1 Tax=Orchesella dallaii TaxID=48710 RepID=A0ABP1RPY1_9HEXA